MGPTLPPLCLLLGSFSWCSGGPQKAAGLSEDGLRKAKHAMLGSWTLRAPPQVHENALGEGKTMLYFGL